GGTRNHALEVRLVGSRSNRGAIGTKVLATVGEHTQVREIRAGSSYLGQNDTRVHFGVGTALGVDRLEIRWPSGRTETLTQVQAGAIITIVEGEGVSGREEIRLGVSRTVGVDAQLRCSSLQETVTITGESPTVDVKSTTGGTNFTRQLLQAIPNARDVWAAMAQAPGVQMTAYDVGGSH